MIIVQIAQGSPFWMSQKAAILRSGPLLDGFPVRRTGACSSWVGGQHPRSRNLLSSAWGLSLGVGIWHRFFTALLTLSHLSTVKCQFASSSSLCVNPSWTRRWSRGSIGRNWSRRGWHRHISELATSRTPLAGLRSAAVWPPALMLLQQSSPQHYCAPFRASVVEGWSHNSSFLSVRRCRLLCAPTVLPILPLVWLTSCSLARSGHYSPTCRTFNGGRWDNQSSL